jgi:predicted metal-dependent phosphoesterase TrpH
MKMVDLHTHSNKSDGSLTPTELVDHAAELGLSAIALTDHDTTEGIDEAISRGFKKGIMVVPGVELSSEYQGQDVHIVGLCIDHHDYDFCNKLNEFVDSRENRNRKMCAKLTVAGMPVDYDELRNTYSDSVITRAHYARFMCEKGYVKSPKEAFERYIGDHSPYFIPREKVTPMDAIKLILSADGIPVLAHPLLYGFGKDRLDTLVCELKEAGLVALEAQYCTYTESDEREMRTLANKYKLLVSGGSDFHGAAKPGLELGKGYGSLCVQESVLNTLLRYKRNLYKTKA